MPPRCCRGRQAGHLAVASLAVAEPVHQYRRNLYLQRLYRAGVTIIHHFALESATGDTVRLRNVFAPELIQTVQADAVVLALGRCRRSRWRRSSAAQGVEVARQATAARRGRSRRRCSRARSRRARSSRRLGAPVIVPELPAEIRELKERVARFIEQEAYPLEAGSPSAARSTMPRSTRCARRARAPASRCSTWRPSTVAPGLSMLAQVALEEEAGKPTNGLGFSVVERGPRELLELASPEQVARFVEPILRGEYREAWALTEPARAPTSPA